MKMKIDTWRAKAVVLLSLMVSAMLALMLFVRIVPPRNAARTTAQMQEAYGRLPLSFEANRGQADGSIDFLARGPGYMLALSSTEAALALSARDAEASSSARPAMLRMNFVGANQKAHPAGVDALEGKVNYLIGSDQDRWQTDIPTYGRVRYNEIYPGIDLVYYGNQRQLEYDFVIAPGMDAGRIAFEFSGAERVEIDEKTGDLLMTVGEKVVRQHKPLGYQETSVGRRKVESHYAMKEGGRVGFEVGEYDRSAPLIIDPVLVYSTYVGGSGGDQGLHVAIDSLGSAYITGFTTSTNFPTVSPIQAANGSFQDAFVTKVNAAGTAFVYSTYLGGDGDDQARGLAVDSAGSAYLTGFTNSTNFPTANAFDATIGTNGNDAFVTKLNAAGNALVYSTYLGGDDNAEFGQAIAVDSAGNAYVTGSTFSDDFPTVNPIQSANAGGSDDAFLSKLNAAGSALVYSTYLGGDGNDSGEGIKVDSAGNAYLGGDTTSTNFPTASPIQAAQAGDGDIFVLKVNAAGNALVYSTYLGGSLRDACEDLAIDSAGNAYVTGDTESNNFPTANAFQSANGGTVLLQDAYVTKINAAGSALVFSTYLGGTGGEVGFGIAVDSAGSVYLAGATGSNTTFPTVNAIQCARAGGADVFATKFNAAGSALIYSTYLGGAQGDQARGVAIDSVGNAYIAGFTSSTDFPTVNAIQSTFGGETPPFGDAFLFKLNDAAGPPCNATPTPTPSPTPTPTPTATPAQLINISTRLRVETGDRVMIGGFILSGNAPKPVVVRALGPSLTGSQVPANEVLLDPTLFLHGPNGELITQNDNWKDSQRSLIEGTIYQPADDRESVIVATLPVAAYTAIVRGKQQTTGIGLVEVYDNGQALDSQLANISTRGFVVNGNNAIIGGFILGGNQGDRRVVIRAIGPSLAASGITDSLQDPVLELKNENGTTLMSNDDWPQNQPVEITASGLAPTDTRESAIVATLPSGRYFAIVQGKTGATGIALVEIYRLP
jgi:hypothetical protein